jgi:hypothetical protein
VTDHTGRTPGADHLPGNKGLEEELREKNPDLKDPPNADEVDERELAGDPDEETR